MNTPGSASNEAKTATVTLDRDSQNGWQSAVQASMERRDAGSGTAESEVSKEFTAMHEYARGLFTRKALEFVQDFGSLKRLPKEQVVGVAAMVFDERFRRGGNTPAEEGKALFEVKDRLLRGETAPVPEPTPETTNQDTQKAVAAVSKEPTEDSSAEADSVPPAEAEESAAASEQGADKDEEVKYEDKPQQAPKQAAAAGNEPPTANVEGLSAKDVKDMKTHGYDLNGVGALEHTAGGPGHEQLRESLRAPRVTLESLKETFKSAVENGASPQALLEMVNSLKHSDVVKSSNLEEVQKALDESHKRGLSFGQMEELDDGVKRYYLEKTPERVAAEVVEAAKKMAEAAGLSGEEVVAALKANETSTDDSNGSAEKTPKKKISLDPGF